MLVWKDIVGYEGLYQASSAGIIKALDRTWLSGMNYQIQKNKPETEIIQKTSPFGYQVVKLTKNGKTKDWFVHRLVAFAFLLRVCNKKYINHKDGNKQNNNVENLEWCTTSENIQHAFDTGLKKPATARGTAAPAAKLTDDNVRFISTSNLSLRKLAAQFNVHNSIINGIKKGKRWAHVA